MTFLPILTQPLHKKINFFLYFIQNPFTQFIYSTIFGAGGLKEPKKISINFKVYTDLKFN